MFENTHTRSCNLLAGAVLAAALLIPTTGSAQASPGDCLSANEATLADLLNDYRVQNGLEPVPVTRSLTMVAQWHVWDLSVNHPQGGQCNLHSWSDWGDLWTPVCYTEDHANASGVWVKPREITDYVYTGAGFEIAYAGSDNPQSALNLWKQSPGHNEIILNEGSWASDTYNPWPAMGVGMLDGYAVVWFGNETDPQGTVLSCTLTPVEETTWGAIKAQYR